MWNGFSTHYKRRGMTLIEVVAGIALLSTLLVSILVTYRAHATQVRSAKKRLQAIELADNLMAGWMSAGNTPSVGHQGQSQRDERLQWRIVDGESQTAKTWGMQVGRLEVFQLLETGSQEVLASVEFLAPSQDRKLP